MQRICGVCVRKDKKDLRQINADTLAMIKKHHYENYCLSWMPKVLCKSCLNILKVKESGVETNKKLLQINYDEMQRPNTQTRACPTCLCHFCAVGKMNGGEFMHYQAQMRQKVGHVKRKLLQIQLQFVILVKVICLLDFHMIALKLVEEKIYLNYLEKAQLELEKLLCPDLLIVFAKIRMSTKKLGPLN